MPKTDDFDMFWDRTGSQIQAVVQVNSADRSRGIYPRFYGIITISHKVYDLYILHNDKN